MKAGVKKLYRKKEHKRLIVRAIRHVVAELGHISYKDMIAKVKQIVGEVASDVTIYRLAKRYVYKKRRSRASRKTATQVVNGQQVWNWPSTGDETATLGSLRVSCTMTESTFDQGIRLIKAGLLLIEGGKSA